MKLLTQATLIIGLVIATTFAEANTIRATDLSGTQWSKLQSGQLDNLIIEFRQGDELPFTFIAEGDLFATTQSVPSYIGIKRTFWMKFSGNSLLLSLDGTNYKPYNEVITGSFNAGVLPDQNSSANSIQMQFKAFLKN